MSLDFVQPFLGLIILLVAICAERFLPLAKSYHPLTLYQLIIQNIRTRIYQANNPTWYQYLAGTLGAVLPAALVLALCFGIISFAHYPQWFAGLILYISLDFQPLKQSLAKIPSLLVHNQKSTARDILKPWLRRQTDTLSSLGIIKASIETLTLRFARHYFVIVFLYLFFGAYVALGYRLLQITRQTWSKKTPINSPLLRPVDTLIYLIEFVPIRLLCLSLILRKAIATPWQNIKKYGQFYYDKNSGWLLSAMSSTLQIQLGGPALYQKRRYAKMRISQHSLPQVTDLILSFNVINQVRFFWLILILFLEILFVALT
ncbi:cobalamin biosynthesis protein [Pseudoalteromonas tunicata]|uniref:cobalamin biosynthesis protein CobD/CbiB n=1 Tax=Pseudoalteromonas tunicata TaxID=314281 RepID=UPI00273D5FC6|nr:cobalamin biosynthesis protein [Pseudoalteromonas tunicata]MDP5214901.1 cobalamin biosynthesis protein [Pseudoalteromonas tunicata]